MLGQFVFDGFVGFFLVARDINIGFRTAVGVAPLVIHDAAPQGQVGSVLVGLGDGGEDIQAARVGIFLELFVDQLARHFGHVFGVHAEDAAVGLDLELLGLGRFVLGR